jgi:hypothetical protein
MSVDGSVVASLRARGPDLAVLCKAWRVRNVAGRFAMDQFSIDFGGGQLTCPAGVRMPFQPGKTVHFPKDACAACPLRARCTASSHGRSVAVHPDEALLAELPAPADPARARGTARTRRRRARPRPRRAMAGPPRPLPRHPQEPVGSAPRRRRPQPQRHRPPAVTDGCQLVARRLTRNWVSSGHAAAAGGGLCRRLGVEQGRRRGSSRAGGVRVRRCLALISAPVLRPLG